VQRLAIAKLAEVVCVGVTTEESDDTIQFAHSVLEWSTGQTPSEVALQFEGGFSSVSGALFDIMSFIELRVHVRTQQWICVKAGNSQRHVSNGRRGRVIAP
jgi:hypothetical protein